MNLKTEAFIAKARLVHGNKYDYSLVNYINANTKITIICPEHGQFKQRASNHLLGINCPKCGVLKSANIRSNNVQIFTTKAIKVHGTKYNYSLVEYVSAIQKVKIICPEHGIFEKTPNKHLSGQGCITCAYSTRNDTFKNADFIVRAKSIHCDRYDYSLVEYINCYSKIKIICDKHGIFEQTPSVHLRGGGCYYCGRINCSITQRLSGDDFIVRAKSVHGDRYDYSLVEYINFNTKIKIICKEHGMFEKTPDSHIAGIGCTICTSLEKDSKGVKLIKDILLKHSIKYNTEVRFNDCKHKNTLPFDFQIIINDVTAIIEFNGMQHFYGWKSDPYSLLQIYTRDKIKRDYLKDNNIPLLDINYWQEDQIEELILEFIEKLKSTN